MPINGTDKGRSRSGNEKKRLKSNGLRFLVSDSILEKKRIFNLFMVGMISFLFIVPILLKLNISFDINWVKTRNVRQSDFEKAKTKIYKIHNAVNLDDNLFSNHASPSPDETEQIVPPFPYQIENETQYQAILKKMKIKNLPLPRGSDYPTLILDVAPDGPFIGQSSYRSDGGYNIVLDFKDFTVNYMTYDYSRGTEYFMHANRSDYDSLKNGNYNGSTILANGVEGLKELEFYYFFFFNYYVFPFQDYYIAIEHFLTPPYEEVNDYTLKDNLEILRKGEWTQDDRDVEKTIVTEVLPKLEFIDRQF